MDTLAILGGSFALIVGTSLIVMQLYSAKHRVNAYILADDINHEAERME